MNHQHDEPITQVEINDRYGIKTMKYFKTHILAETMGRAGELDPKQAGLDGFGHPNQVASAKASSRRSCP